MTVNQMNYQLIKAIDGSKYALPTI